jgi:hypothetical protein
MTYHPTPMKTDGKMGRVLWYSCNDGVSYWQQKKNQATLSNKLDVNSYAAV